MLATPPRARHVVPARSSAALATGTASPCAVAGTTLWLCEEEPGDAYTAMRDAWPTVPSALGELMAALPQPGPPAASPAAASPTAAVAAPPSPWSSSPTSPSTGT